MGADKLTLRTRSADFPPSTAETEADGLAVSSVMVSGLPADERELANGLGVAQGQMKHVCGEVVEVRLDEPPGLWRVWPDLAAGPATSCCRSRVCGEVVNEYAKRRALRAAIIASRSEADVAARLEAVSESLVRLRAILDRPSVVEVALRKT